MKTSILPRLICIIAIAYACNLSTLHATEQKQIPDYDGVGILDDIRANSVVINDIYYRLAPGIEFKSPETKILTRASFARGNLVGFMKDNKKRIVVMWRLQK